MKNLKDLTFELRATNHGPLIVIGTEVDGPMRRLSFYLYLSELQDLLDRRTETATDCSTTLRACGETWTFFRLEIDTYRTSGETTVPYVNVRVPYRVQRIIARWARSARAASRVVSVSATRAERWAKLYGQGTGSVRVDADRLDLSSRIAGDTELVRCLRHVIRIAKNSTFARGQRATLFLRPDGEQGIYWSAMRPNGDRVMNGCIFDHGTEGQHNWSIHT